MLSKKGISLIVLVITILVIIVLAGAVILTVTKQNPLDKAAESKVLSDRSNIVYAIQLQMAKDLEGDNTDTTKFFKGLIVNQNENLTKTIGPIDFSKLKSMEIAPKLSTGLTWCIEATTGKVFIYADTKESLPAWAKISGELNTEDYGDVFEVIPTNPY